MPNEPIAIRNTREIHKNSENSNWFIISGQNVKNFNRLVNPWHDPKFLLVWSRNILHNGIFSV